MSVLIKVEDRLSTYPGRVELTPVSGQTNVYDMVRADEPVQEGTPLNKALLDQKADTLTENVTVYVSTGGSDADGDGSSEAPFAKIQTAINALPKNLGGFTAKIDIAAGTYNERIEVDGFSGGQLVIGVAGRSVVVRGVNITNSNYVTTNISNVTWASGYSGTLYYVGYGSSVAVGYGMTVRCEGSTEVGIGVTYGSKLVAADVVTTVLNCSRSAILATFGSQAALTTITGSGNTAVGLMAERGSIISYTTSSLSATSGNVSRTGGRILSGSGSELAPASVV